MGIRRTSARPGTRSVGTQSAVGRGQTGVSVDEIGANGERAAPVRRQSNDKAGAPSEGGHSIGARSHERRVGRDRARSFTRGDNDERAGELGTRAGPIVADGKRRAPAKRCFARSRKRLHRVRLAILPRGKALARRPRAPTAIDERKTTKISYDRLCRKFVVRYIGWWRASRLGEATISYERLCRKFVLRHIGWRRANRLGEAANSYERLCRKVRATYMCAEQLSARAVWRRGRRL